MDIAETKVVMNEHRGLKWIKVVPANESFVFHKPGDLDTLLTMDWTRFGGANDTIKVVAEGYSDINVSGWDEQDWPLFMPLKGEDFADARGRVFVHEFTARIKPTKFTLPHLSEDMIAELGPITDYLLTYDYNNFERPFGLRVRSLTKEQQSFWFMAKLKRA